MNSVCGTVALAASKRKPHDIGEVGRPRDEDGLGAGPHSGRHRLRLVWRNLVQGLCVVACRADGPRMGLNGSSQKSRAIRPAHGSCRLWHSFAGSHGVLNCPAGHFGIGACVRRSMVRVAGMPASKWSYFGIFYVGFPALAFVLLRGDPDYGFAAILWIFLIVWSADTLAYFAGRIIGGPKLAPLISPKKDLGRPWRGCGRKCTSLNYFCLRHPTEWHLDPCHSCRLPGFGGTGRGSF